ncbi:MAG: DnaA/Hda family protein [Gemmataceae bacterium]|nr:DnaA/Hda family protein [Gemmataceae bacterium]MDW8242430.1 helix-turn-helix domain-containing protein [Thermogemmata sp.]
MVPENAAAVRAVRAQLRAWAQERSALSVVVYGPSGSGKSQLAEGALAWWSQHTDLPACRLAAADWPPAELPGPKGLIILEDIQHLAVRQAESLCQLMDRCQAYGRGVLITSGLPVAELHHLPRRLTSRLSAGLVLPLWPPGAQSRRRIIRTLAHRWHLPLPATAVERLANSPEGLRTALGRLRRLRQQARRLPQTTPDILLQLLQQHLTAEQAPAPATQWERVLQQICQVFGLSRRELLSSSRLGRILLPRQLAIYLLRQAGWSLPQLAQAFGRHHATILHACRQMQQRLQQDTALQAVFRRLQAALH